MEFNTCHNESGEYDVKAIWDSAVYARESESGHLPDLCYLVSWKGYPEEKNTYEPALAVQHLRKLISLFYKNYFVKPTATSPDINSVPLMVRLIVKPMEPLKQKRGQPANSTNKHAQNNWAAFDFYRVFRYIWVIPYLTSLAIVHVTTRDF